MSIYAPYVIERKGAGETAYDIFSRLLKDRIVFIGTEINDHVANIVTAQLLFLQMDDSSKDISIYVNSPGGSVTAGLAIYDTMQFVKCDVATYCIGMAASMGAVFLAGGTAGKRFALPNSRILIHQPSAGTQGTVSDIAIHAREFQRSKEILRDILAKHTGKSADEIEKDSDRDYYMSAAEAKEYGLIDDVITTMKSPDGKK